MRYQISIARHRKGVIRIGGDLATVYCPVGKGVAIVGHCMHCARLAIGISAATAHRATVAWVG